MKKKGIIRKIVVFVTVFLVLGFLARDEEKSSKPEVDFNLNLSGRQIDYSFASQPSEKLNFSEKSATAVMSEIEKQKADYALSYLYELDEVKKRLDFDAEVETHRHSALNEAGVLDAGHLAELVTANNTSFLEEKNFGYTVVEADYLNELCTFIVGVVNRMKDKYPDIDWQRVYCNLGNLKILYDVGMLSYAQVSRDLVLSISKNNTEIVLNMKGDVGFRDVLIHETMHIIQVGCECESFGEKDRRCGISVYWDDFLLNTTDWTWLIEGSAERNMCGLTGGESVSYQYKMDYICSFTMSVLLRDEVKADTMETLCFYDDPELLFDAFGCKTQAERDEILKMMITMEVLQSQPKNFYEAYKKATGTDPRENDETLNNFSYSLKPSVCITLTKEFYANIVSFLSDNQVSANDLFFLINLFEGHLNQHLTYNNESKVQINKPFIESYTAMRKALFDALRTDNPELDIEEMYENYSITLGEEKSLNAELHMLPAEKRRFLAERAQWLAELRALGVKVSAAA